MGTIQRTIEALRKIGMSERELPGQVVDALGDVTIDEVRAVLSEERRGGGERDNAMDERDLAREAATLIVDGDAEFARDLRRAIRAYCDGQGPVQEMDPGDDERRAVRRLRELDEALRAQLDDD